MFGKTEWFLALCISFHSVGCVFFHEQSAIALQSGDLNGSDFGFAMGYWRGSLIVGSPSSNKIGEVYSCPVSSDFTKNCTNVQFNITSKDYTLEKSPDQKFYLGASIAVTQDYFFTCAPLVMKRIKRPKSLNWYTDAFGSCYVYTKDDTSYRAMGPDDRFISGTGKGLGLMEGGIGWNTLADEVNGFLITAKTSLDGDIDYYTIKNFNSKATPTSLVSTSVLSKNLLKKMYNTGYGMAAGKFFSKSTVYAVSMQSTKMTGEIAFFSVVSTKKYSRLVLKNKSKVPYTITSRAVNVMFGYTLAAADLNLDGLSELLVGAPAQSDDTDEVEYGAVHIYLGGDIETCNDVSRMRTIFGIHERGRFGTAIAAMDMDGDNLPEIFASAPYDGDGVVYILSGYDLKKTLLTSTGAKEVSLKQLEKKQVVKRAGMRLLGFSLQVVPDVDGNECDELAIGAPGVAAVLLLKCLQTVTADVSSQIIGQQILKEQDMNVTVHVCVDIGYSSKTANVSGNILVTNDIRGGMGATIDNPSFNIDLSKRLEKECKDIKINFTFAEMADYSLKTIMELIDVDKSLQSKEFDPSWAVLSPYSKLAKNLTIVRRCSDAADCKPKLSFRMEWSGNLNETVPYKLGSSKAETLFVVVRNDGHESYGTCLWVAVQGASISVVDGEQNGDGYEILLQSPLRRNTEQPVNLVLNMDNLLNMNTSLYVTAKLYENCNDKTKFISSELKSPYWFDIEKDLIYLNGTTKDFSITDNDILDENIKSFKDVHDYLIINNGSITWKDVQATITVEKQKVIEAVTTEMDNCVLQEEEEEYRISCNLTVLARESKIVIVSLELSKKEIGKFLNSGQHINETSVIRLYLNPTDEIKVKKLVTVISLKKDKTFGNSRNLIILIAVILSILVLALITYILYKKGFFKRKQKERLDVLRESVRRRSIRLASESKQSRNTSSAADNEHLDMEVVDDCAFEEIPISTNDDVVLVETQAQVLNHEHHN